MSSLARSISKSVLGLLLPLLTLSFSTFTDAAGLMNTSGSFSVTPNGAATYTIPLSVPPGTAGMEPKLSLGYDSQSVNGALGVGWTLAGLSTIHRCAATVAQDGFHGGVNLDGNDRFCMDGQRLIAISGGNGGDGTEYRTEKETFSKIVSYGVSGNGPAYFVVSTKSGQTLEFGVTADSRIAAQGQATVLTWALDKVSDKLGNYFTVSYSNDNANGEYVPTRIDYTGNAGAGLAPQQAVVFTYQSRPDIDHYFFANSAVVHSNRLANVQTFNAGALVTDYRLVYDQSPSTGRSRLTTLTQCAGDGACMPPTNMSWQSASNNFPTTTTNAAVPAWVNDAKTQMFMGDFDGDGKTDLVLQNAAFATTPVMFSNGDGNWRFTNAAVPAWVNDANTQMILGDFNGDGKTDIVLKNAAFGTTPVMFSNGDGNWTITNNPTPSWVNDPNTKMYAGDFNGDGRTDLVLQNLAFGTTPVMFSNGDGNFTIANLPVPSWVNDPNTQMILGDFNGDGRTDILLKNSGFGTTPILFSNGDGSWTIVNNAVPAWVNDPNSQLIAGDFNGDGKTDILVKNPAFTTIHVMFANGNGNWGITEFAIPGWFNAVETKIFTGDFNGDGKTDLGIRNPGFTTNPVLFSNGDGTWTSNNSPAPGWINSVDTLTVAGDFDGDGKTDIAAKNAGFTTTPVMFSDATAPDVISGITTGLGVTTQVTYKSITDPSVYTKDTNATYPIMDVATPVFVVATVAESNGVGGMNSSSYTYAGAKSDAQGRGFLGFRTMRMVDNTTGIVASTDYHQDYPYIGIPSATTKTLGGTLLSQVTNNVAAQPLGGSRYFAYIAQSVEQHNELNGAAVSTITTNTSYDGFGNAVQVTISTSDGYTKTVNNTYSNDTTNWILGKLTQAQLTNTIPGGVTQTRTSSFTYNPANGLLTEEAIEPGTALALVTDYTYDAFGNRTQATVSGPDIQTRSSQTAYDAQGRFPVSSTNALGHRETYAFDGRFGVKTSLTDPNNLTTTWAYDSFGRKLAENRPDGTQTTWTYQYLATGPTPLGFNAPTGYSIAVASTGMPSQTAFYDTLERKTQTQTQGFDGTTIYKSDNYDGLGRLAQSSRNYYAGGNPYWTNYSYDAIGRVATVVEPNGAQTRLAYNGLSTSSTDALNRTTTRIKNTQDQVIQVVDALGNNTYYQYDPFGNLVKTIDPAGNQVAMGYDIRGRKTVMDDPDMGHWTYRYDALGELVGQTDAKGQVITIMYDLIGRMIWRQEPDLTTNWTWDNFLQGKGRLYRVDSDNGYAQGYVYDAYGRPTSIRTAIGGARYDVQMTYDTSGRVNQYWYPTNFTVTNVYNAFGYLAEVHNGTTNALLWRGNAQDADHHSVSETLGNNLVTTRTYDNATGHVSLIQTGASAGTGEIQSQQFTFDAVGNLTQRVDGVTGVNESFSYDSLNRVLTAYNPALGSKSYSYDAIGNITYKSDVGNYTYGPGPHAVATAGYAPTPATYTYDANGNMVNGGGRTVSYTSYNMPSSLSGPGGTVSYLYGPDHTRVQETGPDGTTVYLHARIDNAIHFEKQTAPDGTVKNRHYLYAGSQLIGVYTTQANVADQVRYFHQDHLGSISVITDETGVVVERLSFDPHGKRRYPDGFDDTAGTLTGVTTHHGFTGHEHIDALGLINMNGRVYDPLLGRFLSADPTVQNLFDPQDLNRYAYARNNPLSLVDLDGYGWLSKTWKKIWRNKAVRAVASIFIAVYAPQFLGPAGLGITSVTAQTVTAGFLSGYVGSGGDLKAGAISAMTAGAFNLVGGAAATNGWSPLEKIAAHGLVGGAASVASGGKFGSGFLAAAFTQGMSPVINNIDPAIIGPSLQRTAVAALVGGTASVLGGGNFIDGAMTGAFSRLFNDDTHQMWMDSKGVIHKGADPRFPAGKCATAECGASVLPNRTYTPPTRTQAADFFGDLSRYSDYASGISLMAGNVPAAGTFQVISGGSMIVEQALQPNLKSVIYDTYIDRATAGLPPAIGVPLNIFGKEVGRRINGE